MGLNETPSAARTHIGVFGRRNAGKSSIVNAVTGQETSVVSPVRGTTTDPVQKAMELLPLGPVVLIDTPGLDDEGMLGELRVRRTRQVLRRTDIALLVVDPAEGFGETEAELLRVCREQGVPCVAAINKADLSCAPPALPEGVLSVRVSALTREGIPALKEALAAAVPQEEEAPLAADLIPAGGVAVLVVPIDKAAPKGRLILPQQQVLRDLLDNGRAGIVCRESELTRTLSALSAPPDIVVTDSQAFAQVDALTPPDVALTSFSILMARRKGVLAAAVEGVAAARRLRDGERVLVCEGCTHHRQCGDIGTQKIPGWLREYAGCAPDFTFTSGGDFPEDLSGFRLIVHCGGCMLNGREMRYRLRTAQAAGVPMTNYGILIAEMKGILRRSIRMLPDVSGLLDG